jgi:hypothetical protein
MKFAFKSLLALALVLGILALAEARAGGPVYQGSQQGGKQQCGTQGPTQCWWQTQQQCGTQCPTQGTSCWWQSQQQCGTQSQQRVIKYRVGYIYIKYR